MAAEKWLIFIPTYNERDNIPPLYLEIKNLGLNTDILFLDDHSPDGSGDRIDEIQQADPRVFVIHRSGKLGIGSAHKEGIVWAYSHGYQKLLTMDADFTHSPEYIPLLFAILEQNEIAIGSRYLMKNSLKDWNVVRKCLTKTAHFLTSTLLEFPYDSTSAFRAYRLDAISVDDFLSIKSDSYSFFFESLNRLHLKHYKIKELPINLPVRTYGSSKMSYLDPFKSLYLLFKLYKDQA